MNSVFTFAAGLLAGVIATVVGVLLQNFLETQQNNEAIFSAAKEELRTNVIILERNLEIVREDLALNAKRQTILSALSLLQSNALDLLKSHPPTQLIRDSDTMVKTREVSLSINNLNENIRSRQNYQIANTAMSNYYPVLGVYDKLLLEQHKMLKEKTDQLNSKLPSAKAGASIHLGTTDTLSMIGLVLDIFGALFLAKAFMFKKAQAILRESGTYWDSNDVLRDSLVNQRIEAWIGGLFLTSGFVLQCTPYFLRVESKPPFLAALIISFLVLWFTFDLFVRELAKRTIAKLERTQAWTAIEEFEQRNPGQVFGELTLWGKRVGQPRMNEESDPDYQARLKSYLSENSRHKLK
jgi:hypothetical protein